MSYRCLSTGFLNLIVQFFIMSNTVDLRGTSFERSHDASPVHYT